MNRSNSCLYLLSIFFLAVPPFLSFGVSQESTGKHAACRETAPVLSADRDRVFLGPFLDYLEDPDGNLKISQIISKEIQDRFRGCNQKSPGFGFTDSAFWFRFSIQNPTGRPLTRYLEIEYPLLDSVKLFVPDGEGGYHPLEQGDHLTFEKRIIPYRNIVFNLHLPPHSTALYFLRVQTSSSLNLPAYLYSEPAFINRVETEDLALGIYFGILFAMLAYNLLLFFNIREAVYLYYVLFVIFYFLFQLDLTGVAFKYLWPSWIGWANISLPFFILTAYTFGTLFTRKILNSGKHAPFLDKVLCFFLIITSIGSVASLFLPYEISIRMATLVTTTVFVHILTGYVCLYRGWRPARYYALAWTVSMGGAAIYALKSFGVLPNNFFTIWGIQIGSAWEVILLSMALSDRLTLLQREKDQLQTKYTRELEEANRRLEDFARNLEEKVKQRTKELEESNRLLKTQTEEMRRAEEQAERANQAKSLFLANMSHEIRTPLNAITGITALAMEMDITGKLRDYLKVIKVSADSLLDLVNDILDFSKIEAGKMELETLEFNLLELLEKIADVFAEQASAKGIDLIIHIDREVPENLQGDPVRLGQLLTNLTSNAIKFTEEGKVIVRCSLIEQEAGIVHLRFQVMDTGIGVEEQRQQDLFEVFTQADSSTTRRYGGSGLGLAICRKIATLMDGTISMESAPGKGTTFTFEVKLELASSSDRNGPGQGETLFPLLNEKKKPLAIHLLYQQQEVEKSIREQLARLGSKLKSSIRIDGFHLDKETALPCTHNGIDLFIIDIPPQELIPADLLIAFTGLIMEQYEEQAAPLFILLAPQCKTAEIEQLFHGHKEILTSPRPATPFRLQRALAKIVAREDSPEGLPGQESSAVRTGFRNVKILVVEDNEINQMVAREILVKHGATVEFANNGLEALEKASTDHDLILMDVQMPEMDGYEATRILKKRPNIGKIPIIAMTASVFRQDRQRCARAGMDDFIMKPVTPESLMAVLKKWIPEEKQRILSPSSDEQHGDTMQNHAEKTWNTGEVPGADMEQVRSRFGQDLSLYLELLERFVSDMEGLSQHLETLIEKGRFSELKRFFHTQKGVCLNLALNELGAHFLQAEMKSTQEPEALWGIIPAIEKKIASIASFIEETGNKRGELKAEREKPAADRDNAELLQKILELDELLQLNDIESESIWHELRAELRTIIPKEPIHQITDLIAEMEFEAASAMLQEICSNLQEHSSSM